MFGIYQGVLMKSLKAILEKNESKIGRVVQFDLNKEKLVIFDFTENNKNLRKINIASAEEFDNYIKKTLLLNETKVGIGRYSEDRFIYKHSSLFEDGIKSRTIHLGIDIFLPVKTKILSPFNAIIHSFQNNKRNGDYGPTIILQHKIDGIIFYTLYGHLSKESLYRKKENQKIKKGEIIGEIGGMKINGGWPEHVHFQIIKDVGEMRGDFPGVANINERQEYLKLCPDPNLILKIKKLKL